MIHVGQLKEIHPVFAEDVRNRIVLVDKGLRGLKMDST
jgi:hypothetical protein